MKIAFFSAALMAIASATHIHHHITDELAQIDADALPPMRRSVMLVRGVNGKPPTEVDVTECK